MKDILTNLKTLFFSYTSIVVLLFFAIIQSNQKTYDVALSQLEEVEKRASAYNSDSLQSLISRFAGLGAGAQKTTLRVETIGTDVEFHFPEKSADYSTINTQLQRSSPTGFKFGIGNRTKSHPEFTEVTGLQSYFIPIGTPFTLDTYEAIHNGSLQSILLPVFAPDLSNARIEAFQYKTTKYNSIEKINMTEYQKVKVIDNVQLVNTKQSSDTVISAKKACYLDPVVTAINSRYSFMCSISEFNLDSVKYSGARVLVPANTTTVQIPKNSLLGILNTPPSDRRPFDRAFQELATIAEPYANLPFEQIEKIISAEKARNPSKLSVFGAEINIPLLTQLVVPLLILICLYISLHLKEAIVRAQNMTDDKHKEVPWIAVYQSAINEHVLLAQLLLLPLVLVITIQLKSHGIGQPIFTWAMFALLVAVNIRNFTLLRRLRKLLNAKNRSKTNLGGNQI